MSVPALLYMPGFVLELIGLIIVAKGFYGLWYTFASDDRFTAPAARWFAGAKAAAVRFARAALRRPATQTVVGAGLASGSALSANATVRIGYPNVPSIRDDPEGYAAKMNEIIEDLSRRIHEAREEANTAIGAEVASRQAAHGEVRKEIAAVDARVRDLAVGDIRLQVFGWVLVLVGFFLQSVSQMMTLPK